MAAELTGVDSVVGRPVIEALMTPDRARVAVGAALARGPGREIARTSLAFGSGELLLMPAEDGELTGVKVLTLASATTPGTPSARGLYVLFDARTLAPLLALDGAALTEVRTAAVSAWATDVLAPPGPATLALFGSGRQARAHLVALAAVRPVEEVLVVARDDRRIAAIVELAGSLGIAAGRAEAAEVRRAGIVCCCTSSAEPLFDGTTLSAGTHVVAVGSHRPERRELDAATVRRSTVVVETRESALAEAGDLLLAASEGAFAPGDIAADLFELARSPLAAAPGRDLTLFKSVGVGFEDLAIARAVLESMGGR